MKSTLPLFAFALLAVPAHPATAGDAESRTRDYRPLEAKSVAIHTAAMVREPAPGADGAESHIRRAWVHFDRREWDAATDAFLSALERDRHDVEAAEGLAMSVYRAGRFDDAHRLGVKMQSLAPSVGEVIAEAVIADVRSLVKREDRDAARELLEHFPESDPKYTEAHRLVGDAAAIASALEPNGDTTAATGGDSVEPLVRN